MMAQTVARPPAALARLTVGMVALGAIVTARAALNGSTSASAFAAGLTLGVGLVGLALVMGWRGGRPKMSAIVIGLAGGVVLVAAPLLTSDAPPAPPALHPVPLAAWIAVTVVVASAEEVALRGALWHAAQEVHGPWLALVLSSTAFALMHVPLYGWHVLPLDLGVGIFLGGLRLASGGVAAPAIAHAVADLLTWWV
jgi:membrane protease YdiL (CAAX protease family)